MPNYADTYQCCKGCVFSSSPHALICLPNVRAFSAPSVRQNFPLCWFKIENGLFRHGLIVQKLALTVCKACMLLTGSRKFFFGHSGIAWQSTYILYITCTLYTVPKVVHFPRYNTKNSEIFCVVSRFPLHFVLNLGNFDYFLSFKSFWTM